MKTLVSCLAAALFAALSVTPAAAQPKARIKLAEGLTVRNEFIECDLDVNTGGIRSFRDARTRATRFGQQLVFNPGSKMVARDIAVTNNGAALGERTMSVCANAAAGDPHSAARTASTGPACRTADLKRC